MYFKREIGTNPYSVNILTNGVDIQAIPVTLPKDSPLAQDIDGRKIILRGTVYPTNDENAIGLVRHDYDVTDGEVAGAVITHGSILEEKLHTAPSAGARTALEARGIMFTKKATAVDL